MPVGETQTSLALGTALHVPPNHAGAAAGSPGQYHVVRGSREGTAVWARTRAGWLWAVRAGLHEKEHGMNVFRINAVIVDPFGTRMNGPDSGVVETHRLRTLIGFPGAHLAGEGDHARRIAVHECGGLEEGGRVVEEAHTTWSICRAPEDDAAMPVEALPCQAIVPDNTSHRSEARDCDMTTRGSTTTPTAELPVNL